MVQHSIYKTENGKNIIIDYYTQLLENWPKPNHRQYISTRYGETFVISCGNKSVQPMVLLHGSSSNSAMWMTDVIEYSKYYHVYAIDIIGECGLSAETRPEWKENNYANWLSDIFENLRIEKALIVLVQWKDGFHLISV